MFDDFDVPDENMDHMAIWRKYTPGIPRCQSHLRWVHRDRCTSHPACSMASQVLGENSPVFTIFHHVFSSTCHDFLRQT